MNSTTNTPRLKILISAYACEPYVGSEEGTAWNTVIELSKYHDLWVIVNSEYEAAITAYIKKSPIANVEWIFYDYTTLFSTTRKKELIRRAHYYIWQQITYFKAKELSKKVDFDASLHITYGSYWRPSFLGYLPIPFVWGPVGGAENAPVRWFGTIGNKAIVWEVSKMFLELIGNTIDFTVRITAHSSKAALVSTETTYKRVKGLGAKNVIYVPQVRLPKKDIVMLEGLPERTPSDKVRFFSSGRLIGWKGIHLAARAFAKVVKECPDAEYQHVGDGMLAVSIRALTDELGISDKFKIVEGKKRQENLEMMADADVFVFPCLHNEPGWVVVEAMFVGLPIVFLRGMPRTPKAETIGFRSESKDLETAIDEMANAMIKLAKDPALREEMGKASREEAKSYLSFDHTVMDIKEALESVAKRKVVMPAGTTSGTV